MLPSLPTIKIKMLIILNGLLDLSRITPLLAWIDSYILSYSIISLIIFINTIPCILILKKIIFKEMPEKKFPIRHYLVVLYWIYMVPVTEIYLSIAHCKEVDNALIFKNITCGSLEHWLAIGILAPFSLIWFAGILVLSFALTNSHAHESNPLAHYPNSFELYYTIVRIFLAFHHSFSPMDGMYYFLNLGISVSEKNLTSIIIFSLKIITLANCLWIFAEYLSEYSTFLLLQHKLRFHFNKSMVYFDQLSL